MTVTMERDLRLRLINYCRSSYPQEACGLIIGNVAADSGSMTADDFVPMRNASQAPRTEFQMDPAQLIAELAHTPAPRLIGIFHSHPRSQAVPSAADLQTAWYTLPSHWIVSLQDADDPQLAVFRLARMGERTVAVPISIRQKEDSA